MLGSGLLVRLRGVVVAAVVVLGYWAPWNYGLHLDGSGPNAHAWGVLSVALSKSGAAGIGPAFQIVLAFGIACALAAAVCRTRAAARGGVRLRYAGTLLHVVALALLMPLSGAVFAIAAAAALAWLLGGTETEGVGWGRAALLEIYFWAVAGSFAVAGWGYNAGLLVRCVLVSAGVGLVVRGLVPQPATALSEPSPAGAQGKPQAGDETA